MLHAFLASIGWHAGRLALQVIVLTVVVGSLGLWARHLLRRLKRTMGGRR